MNVGLFYHLCRMMQVQQFVFNEFQENTYVVYDDSGECIIFDPGCHHAGEQKMLSDFIDSHKLKPVKLINTHCHIDHVLGNAYVSKKYNLPLHLHRDELKTYEDTGRWAELFGMVLEEIPDQKIFITEKDKINFGLSTLDIFFTPGHSIASLSFYNRDEKLCISGDVLFMESIGRTDLPGGNYETLIRSIREKLFSLGDDTRVFSGHGYPTTIGHERKFNPFLQG